MKSKDIIIIGSGPAGQTAAIYSARAGYKTLLIEGIMAGGQLMLTTEIENFPGFPEGITGPDLMKKMKHQAQKFNTEFISGDVTNVDFKTNPFKIHVENKEYNSKTVIIATGAVAKFLDIPAVHALKGRGVSACATCDGFFFKDKIVYVIGGGDTAAKEALFLTNFAREVHIVHRRDKLRSEKYLQKKLFKNPKINIIWDSVMEDVMDTQKEKVEKILLKNVKTGEITKKSADGIFMAVGHSPSTNIFKDHIKLNKEGYIEVKDNVKTSINGVFAAGDVIDPDYRQAITSAGTGCMASLEADKFLQSL